MNAKDSFVGLNERNVLGHVGRFGEDLMAHLLKGEVVSDQVESYPTADVVRLDRRLAAQVKMCNARHAQRPVPNQVVDLFNEVQQGFLFDSGVYAFVFYRGVEYSRKRSGKSKIWSRKISREMRREIIARELQYVYIFDVRLLQFFIDRHIFLRERAIVFDPDAKPHRQTVLYLNRTLMKQFRDRAICRQLLDQAFGPRRWALRSLELRVRFVDGMIDFSSVLPIHVVGNRRTVRTVADALQTHSCVSLGN